MRTLPKLVIGGAAALAIVSIATAAIRDTHVMTVRLPGGGMERIFYTGDAQPRVRFAAASPAAFADPFAVMERLSADMDRQTAAMLGQADMMLNDPLGAAPMIGPYRLTQANLGGMAALPAGAQAYSFVSTVSGAGFCSRSVEITSRGDGAKPTVVTRTSGDCAGARADHPAAQTLERPPIAEPRLTETTWSPARWDEQRRSGSTLAD